MKSTLSARFKGPIPRGVEVDKRGGHSINQYENFDPAFLRTHKGIPQPLLLFQNSFFFIVLFCTRMKGNQAQSCDRIFQLVRSQGGMNLSELVKVLMDDLCT